MICPSDKSPIYYMTARVAFKKRKAVYERVMWLVSVFSNPSDIARYDYKTMHRLGEKLYGRDAKSKKQIIIRTIIDSKVIGQSNLTLNEHKKQNKKQV